MIDTSSLSILCSDRPMSNADRLAEWRIAYSPKPIPDRSHDWEFSHVDYDGPPDTRCGTAKSEADAISQIEEITSPPERHPQRVSFLSVFWDALGLCLAVGLPVALVTLAAAYMGLFE